MLMIYNYISKKKNFKCHICKYSCDLLDDFSKHLTSKHKILIPDNISTKNGIINALNINFDKNNNEENLCVICLDKEKTTAFFRCGHKVCCHDCAKNILKNNNKELRKCPVCRKVVGGILRIYD
tara:strand:- start:864 stop:1235 length:372 start_codon:yes stop_codon:yes gene_type:complete